MPTFGFGGSSDSEEVRGFVQMPLNRNRLYIQSDALWRRSTPLEIEELELDTIQVSNTLGYAVVRWFRLEAFHIFTRQDSRHYRWRDQSQSRRPAARSLTTHEDPLMEERSSFHPLDYVSVFRRRKWWLITPLLVALVAGAIAVFVLPKEYKSESTIGVAAPTLSPEILKGVSSLDATERQRAISQHLLGNAVLERVVREEQIDPKKPTEEVAAWLRKRIYPVRADADRRLVTRR